jgi:phosphate starvation-inducible PhoH-like protein
MKTKIDTRVFMRLKKQQTPISNLYNPRTEKQRKYVKYLDDNNAKIIFSLGPAGTGKTLFACQKAITQLKSEEINKIIITRPAVTVEEEIGFLPGNIVKKMDPWTKPIFDIFHEYFSKTEIDLMLNNNKIEICPLAFMRGRTFKNTFIIADEMQNSSPNQMKMLTTRLGDNSRMVITGDLHQSDIKTVNGLNDFILKINQYKSIKNLTLINIIEFDNVDIERSEIVKKVIEIYDYNTSNNALNTIESKIDTKKDVSKIKLEPKIEPKPKSKLNMDAALIPRHHITHNYDIFFEARDF